MACITASIAKKMIADGFEIGIFINNQKNDYLPLDKEFRQLNKVLDILAFLEGDGELEFVEYVNQVTKSIPIGSSILLLSPSKQDGLNELAGSLVAKGYHPHLFKLFSGNENDQTNLRENEDIKRTKYSSYRN